MNICYLEFVDFSLGASGMVRQNLQKNDSVTQGIFQMIRIPHRARLWLRIKILPICITAFQWILRMRKLTLASRIIYKSNNVSLHPITMLPSFPKRDTLHRLAVAYLIINAHVYSVLPEAMYLHISSFCVSLSL